MALVKNTCTPVSRILVTLSNNARFRLDYADCLAADVTVMLAAVVPHDQEAGVVTQFDPTADAVLPLPEVVGVVNAGLVLVACTLVISEYSNWLLKASQINTTAPELSGTW